MRRPTMYHLTRLPSGLTVTTAAMPHMASISLGLWIGVGGRYEPGNLNGASHFIEHMLFKGTRRRSAREISQAIEGIGGYLNAFTGEESTCFYAKGRHDRFDELLDVLSDMFLESRFAPADVDKERGVIKDELAMYLDQPQHHVQELLNEILWPNHPLGRPLTGTARTLDALGRKELMAFQRTHYVIPGMVIAAAGNLSHRKVIQAVSRWAPRFPRGQRPQCDAVNDDQQQPVLRLFTKQTEQTQLALGIRTCSRHDPRRFALRLLNTVLGENMSSRLFQVVREDRGLAYSIYSVLSFFDDVGVLNVSAGLDPQHMEQVLKLIMHELRRLSDRLLTRAEMRRARDYVIGQLDLSLEGTENQMMWLGEQYLGYGRIGAATEIKHRLCAVKASEIRAVARAFFRPERMNLAMVSPLKAAGSLVRLMKR